MPLPIRPLHNEDSYYNSLFSQSTSNYVTDDVALAQRYFSQEKVNNNSIDLLEAIDKSDDGLVNAAVNYYKGENGSEYKNVPNKITDNQILKLKTEGYLTGQGRSVLFTAKAKEALKNRYLSSTNSMKEKRKGK